MSEQAAPPFRASLVAACTHLLALSLRRQFFVRQTVICVALSALGALIVWGWSMQKDPTLKEFAEEILVPVHVAFLVPVFAICYGAAAVGTEREDRTLVYLLITPLPRPYVYLMKFIAALLLVVVWTAASMAIMGIVGRPWGSEAVGEFWPAIMLGAVAYTSLFSALGAAFRRGTIISLAYAFFLEGLLGNMPGIVKRISISFYVKCMIYDSGSEHGIGPLIARELFIPITGHTATVVLSFLAVAFLLLGIVTFSRREYRDLS